jgi:hypothetical protein
VHFNGVHPEYCIGQQHSNGDTIGEMSWGFLYSVKNLKLRYYFNEFRENMQRLAVISIQVKKEIK